MYILCVYIICTCTSVLCEIFDTTHASADSCVSVVGIRINIRFTEGETLLISE